MYWWKKKKILICLWNFCIVFLGFFFVCLAQCHFQLWAWSFLYLKNLFSTLTLTGFILILKLHPRFSFLQDTFIVWDELLSEILPLSSHIYSINMTCLLVHLLIRWGIPYTQVNILFIKESSDPRCVPSPHRQMVIIVEWMDGTADNILINILKTKYLFFSHSKHPLQV